MQVFDNSGGIANPREQSGDAVAMPPSDRTQPGPQPAQAISTANRPAQASVGTMQSSNQIPKGALPTLGFEAISNDEIAPCLSVVMPVFNEEASVLNTLKMVLAQRPVLEVIVVDDASQDASWKLLRELGQNESR